MLMETYTLSSVLISEGGCYFSMIVKHSDFSFSVFTDNLIRL